MISKTTLQTPKAIKDLVVECGQESWQKDRERLVTPQTEEGSGPDGANKETE